MKRLCMVFAAMSPLIVLAFAVAACSENPNEHVQSNELFRPPAPSMSFTPQDAQQAQQERAADAEQQSDQPAAQDAESDQSSTADGQQAQPADDGAQEDAVDAPQDSQAAQDEEAGAPLQTTEDVIRRYANPTFGYSLELICSPFCSPTSNGIDSVTFSSETGRALIGVDVHLDDETPSETLIRTWLALGDQIEFSSIEPTTLITGEAAERYIWDEDRRATGGFQVRWQAVLVRAHDLAFVLRAGAVMEDYESVAPALERALGSFLLPGEIAARPGRYDRFDFVIDYDTADFAQEFGQPTSSPPSDQSGIFVLQTSTSLKAVLTWQLLGEAFYDGDNAITQSLRDSLGIEQATGFRDAAAVDGRAARTGESETPFGDGVLMIRSYAWYCNESGREFVLHVLDAADPEPIALELIEGFRCSATSDAESDD